KKREAHAARPAVNFYSAYLRTSGSPKTGNRLGPRGPTNMVSAEISLSRARGPEGRGRPIAARHGADIDGERRLPIGRRRRQANGAQGFQGQGKERARDRRARDRRAARNENDRRARPQRPRQRGLA